MESKNALVYLLLFITDIFQQLLEKEAGCSDDASFSLMICTSLLQGV